MVSLKFKLLGTDIEQRILILIFKELNYRVEILVGQNLRTEYLKRYKTSLNRIQEFIFEYFRGIGSCILELFHLKQGMANSVYQNLHNGNSIMYIFKDI
ncbi:hypothetical protein EG344_00380 [Chryseobacterium sp. G0162]|nr:hypothetical protein EG344_00380 [Chryseobacterium sp. G0162]